MKKLLVLLTILMFFTGTPLYASVPEVRDYLESLIKSSEAAATSSVGVYMKVLPEGEVLCAYHENQPMTPSSNLKVVTSSAALHYLGAGFVYETSLYGTPVDAGRGVMESSLYLVGSGDPTLGPPFTDHATLVWDRFARQLSAMGLTRIVGDVVGDDSVFDREFQGRGWKQRYLLDDYAAQCGGLSINANLIQITACPGRVSFLPNCSIMEIFNKTSYDSPNEFSVRREAGSNRLHINGMASAEIPGGAVITVHNPPLFATDVFGKILSDYGIYPTGRVKLIEDSEKRYKYESLVALCTHKSPPLSEILKPMNKDSDNFIAQQVFRTVGAEIKGKGSHDNSEAAVKEFMRGAGIDVTGFSMADGSGLSDLNRVTARQLVEILSHMYTHQEREAFLASFPRAGVDGTIRYRMAGKKVLAKTGTINENSSLSGYVRTADDKLVVFAVISNSHELGQSVYKGFEDLLVSSVAESVLD